MTTRVLIASLMFLLLAACRRSDLDVSGEWRGIQKNSCDTERGQWDLYVPGYLANGYFSHGRYNVANHIGYPIGQRGHYKVNGHVITEEYDNGEQANYTIIFHSKDSLVLQQVTNNCTETIYLTTKRD